MKKLLITILIISSAFLYSCMTVRVVAQYDSNNPVPIKVKRTVLFWGLLQPKDVLTGEICESICKVEAKNNGLRIFVSAATLGIVVPMRLDYECCAYDPGNSEI
ncbi:hypothetical protein HZR84_12030 [Hyphobacterium sp. CCMP332]|nr:hypothetical protein HZR84_12030 [Hyphobacterium sp. CCMP332]